MDCGKGTDFIYPLLADVYYPIVEQGAYGDVKKQWVLDKSIPCYFASAGSAGKEEIIPNVNITQETVLVGRTKSDIRISSQDGKNSLTNVIVTNIRDASCTPIYVETAGIRAGKSTIFEVATQDPTVGAFGGVDFYKLVIRRSENQAADV